MSAYFNRYTVISMTIIKPTQMAARVPHCPCNTALAFSSSIILASKFCIGTSTVDEIVKWVIANTERIISIVAIIASYFIGVYSNRRNDRRKEFNAVAEPIHLRMLEALAGIGRDYIPRHEVIKETEITALSLHFYGKKKAKLITANKDLSRLISRVARDKYGRPEHDEELELLITEKVKTLIALTKRK